MRTLIMYHDHCTDGFGAAYVAWTRFEDAAEYLPMSYGQVKTISDLANLSKQPIESYQEIYVMDFSLPKDVMEWLFKAGKRVIWLDHHKTAFEMYELPIGQFEDVTDDRHVELDNDKSGAMLAWEHFYPADDCPKMIEHIDDRDRWQFKIPGTKEFHAFMASNKPWTFQQWNDIFGEMERGF